MQVSKLERILMTNVSYYASTRIGFLIRKPIDLVRVVFRDIEAMYFDRDTWEDECTDMDDAQLRNLGIDVEQMNHDYWGYNTRESRRY